MSGTADTGKKPEPDHDRLPILVAVTGKRQFARDPARNGACLEEFRHRFRNVVTMLDQELPDTPKVLLCGGASGVDLAAANVILPRDGTEGHHSSWSVAIILPFDMALFEEDFSTPDLAEELSRLRALCAGHPRVVVKTLRRLYCEPFDDSKLEPANAPRIETALLSRTSAHYERDQRAAHYEQLGLWLARTASILVAASPHETADIARNAKPGGTARVIAFRRTAIPDPTAEGVISRSSELLTASPLEEPDGGYVLWIDPTVPGRSRVARETTHVLRPIQLVCDMREEGTSLERARAAIYADPTKDRLPDDSRDAKRERDHRWKGALALARSFQAFHYRRRGPYRGQHAPPALGGPEHPADFLRNVRNKGALNAQQTTSAVIARLAQRWCAFLFVLAAASYECSTEILPDRIVPLVLYVGLLFLIFAIAEWVCYRHIQVRAEDYRGLREMMRVQIAWWSAGINRMVDRVHLRIIDSDLRLVREAAAAASLWAVLRCRRLQTFDIGRFCYAPGEPVVYPSKDDAEAWIKSQVDYFSVNARAQFGAKRVAELAFHITLLTALAGLIMLAVFQFAEYWMSDDKMLSRWLCRMQTPALIAFPVVTAVTTMGALWVITGDPLGSGDRVRERAEARRAPHRETGLLAWSSLLLSVPVTMPVAALILAAMAIGAEVSHRLSGTVARALPDWATLAPPWAGPAAFLLLLMFTMFLRIPNRARSFDVRRLGPLQKFASVLLLVSALYVTAAVFAPAIALIQSALSPDLAKAFRSLILVQAVLLLAGAGMIRWYTERRNHLAQAAHYDDMLRAFRRARDWWAHHSGALDDAARERLIELGELALDEGEAWLKAHRDRPAEAIAGA